MKLFRGSKLFVTAFHKMAKFLRHWKEELTADGLVSLATEALPGLYFFPNVEFIASTVEVCITRQV